MNRARACTLVLTALAALTCSGGRLSAADLYDKKAAPTEHVKLPKPAEVQTLAVQPDQVTLKGSDDATQLIVTATLARQQAARPHRRRQVRSRRRRRSLASPPPAASSRSPTAPPRSPPRYGDKTVKVAVDAEKMDENLPINFANQIVPIFTKLGCNSRRLPRQVGRPERLPPVAARLRARARLSDRSSRKPAAAACSPPPRTAACCCSRRPAASPTAAARRMEVGSDEYKLVRRWIASGTPVRQARPTRPSTKITVYPEHRVLTRQQPASSSPSTPTTRDGTVEDITRRAQYESNDTEIAVVDGAGLVRTLAMSGEAAIMARYQGQVAVFRATVPLGVQDARLQVRAARPSSISSPQKKWQELGLVPVRAVHRRAVHPPRLARPHRHAADAGAGQGVRRRQGRRTSATS